MNAKLTPAVLTGALLIAACGGGSDADSFDTERACRVGQRLVEETAEGDRDGAIRQIERLDDLDGFDGSGVDVDDLDSIAEGLDEQAVEDLVAEFDVLGCDLDGDAVEIDDTVAPAPSTDAVTTTTEPVSTEPPPTEPPATEPPATDPPVTEPPATDAPAETAAPEPTPPPSGTGIAVDIGSSGPGAAIGVDRPTEDILADYAIAEFVFSPNTNVVELNVSRTDSSFGDEVAYSNLESITMTATTTMGIEEVRAAYRTALEGSGGDFEFSESTFSNDGQDTVAIEASASDFDAEVQTWSVAVARGTDNADLVLIEVERRSTVSGPVAAIAEPARPLLQQTADIASNLGWAFSGYSYTLNVNSFDGSLFESGRVEWDVSEDNTVREAATAVQDAIGVPIDNEDVETETISWAEDTEDRSLWFVNYTEFSGTTASYNA